MAPQPSEVSEDLLDNDEGVKKGKVTVGAVIAQPDFWNALFQRYSAWDRLRRIVAWLMGALQRSVQSPSQIEMDRSLKHSPKPLSVLNVDKAETKIVKFTQEQSFMNEKDETATRGRLARLKPFDEQGILRLGGRLNHSGLQYDAKHPMILPAKHPVSELIIRH